MPGAALVAFAAGAVISALGLAALIGHVLRPKPRDRLLLWLGVFALIYGVRLLADTPPVATLVMTRRHAAYVVAVLSCAIVLPAILFTEELYGPGWRRSLRWLAVVAAAFGAVVTAVGLVTGDPRRIVDPALIVLMPGLLFVFAAGALTGYHPKPFPEWRTLVAGVVVFVAFVLHEHAVNNHLVPWTLRIEPLGMLLFNASLAYVAVSRFFANQGQLIAIEKEMDAARRIQTSILPREVPAAAGIDVAVRYEPLAAVAGDFYDIVQREDGGVVLLVADVSGHGVPAALIASMVKVAFVAETSRSSDPASILGGMNGTLCGLFERAYVTAACVAIDPPPRPIRYALAGHPPPLLVSRTGEVQTLDERGMFIGMFPSATYVTAAAEVSDGTRLIVYTDGVTEAPAPAGDDLFGLDRLTAWAAAERARPAASFVDALLHEVRAFARADPLPHDDVTVVVVDVGRAAGAAPGGAAKTTLPAA